MANISLEPQEKEKVTYLQNQPYDEVVEVSSLEGMEDAETQEKNIDVLSDEEVERNSVNENPDIKEPVSHALLAPPRPLPSARVQGLEKPESDDGSQNSQEGDEDDDDDDDDEEEEEAEIQVEGSRPTTQRARPSSARPRTTTIRKHVIPQPVSLPVPLLARRHVNMQDDDDSLSLGLSEDSMSVSDAQISRGLFMRTNSIDLEEQLYVSQERDRMYLQLPYGQGGRQYDPADYEHLSVSAEMKELFQYITRYTPQTIELEHKIKPFIPDFIPAVGDIDAFLKVPRPDNKDEKLGFYALDEPRAKQSDPTVLDLQLRAVTKETTTKTTAVKRLDNADKNTKEIDTWINSIGQLHRSKPPPTVHYPKNMPDIDSLMQEWPPEFEEMLKEVGLPSAEIQCSLEDYVEIVCCTYQEFSLLIEL
ncbi:intraflagellar transport protein 46 homolog isoform X1 [Limulus polyphemus]|uniref:Intraflagellar transport protein 46 homolog n=1 Tax=Limulus polyphemus TaxID=6850 RepID=A0ABM1T1N2_LIMPO|nr:intraflagellar transport protein 46 homolog isoform X1 [Limulus polyphemus]